ncbi:unnamed protein product [Gulo gulo]|uniref:Uncharacterized protein n=1 Tax=Gulo gulo TaxID=48420 RepID=A0A9X9Q1M6_GULGU|nr:unnamed protein product [Gulo gulo]
MVVGVDGGSFVEFRCLIHEIKSIPEMLKSSFRGSIHLKQQKIRETLKMLDFLYLLRKASWNLLKLFLSSVQPQTVLMVRIKYYFCKSHVDTAMPLNQMLLSGWWEQRPRPRPRRLLRHKEAGD